MECFFAFAHFWVASGGENGIIVAESRAKWMEVGKTASFLGEYRHSLDAKKRLIIPAKFRESLSDTFYVTRGLDGCLACYTNDSWAEQIEQLSRLPSTNRKARQYVRSITSKAQESTLDNQGRLQLPQYLIELAGIEKACVIVGVSDHFEIWSEERWKNIEDEADASFEDDAELLTGFLTPQ